MGEGNLFWVLREGTAKFGGFGSIDVSSHLGLKLEEQYVLNVWYE